MRGNELSATKREQIIGVYLSGVKQKIISTQLDIPTSTVSDTIKRYKETGSAIPEKRSGRPKILTQCDTQVLRHIVRTDWFSSLDEWKQVVWSDESRFALFESDGRVKVWRSPGEAYNKDCIQPTVKFGGGSVMFWGCFGWHGVGPLVVIDGNMNSDDYVNVLANHFIPWVNNYPGYIFQQDEASCHTSNYSIWWMRTHNVPMLDWVAQSPDLNPIENLWDHLDRQVRKRKSLPKSKQELISVVQEEWRKISIETLTHLILSLPSRIEAVIKAKGGHTKY
ncbi:unnamed protein product [Rhizophagus irregularis]|nr:unnamed protein product [Rhizophagus irregularis]CAB5380543.1 unnamed protein product [Rhizophagus irregularis]